ncbi:MAG: pyridoxal 5'-phosphate synthase glutaminase subunit PdxT [Thermoplasmatota archaeon]
MRIGVLALQGAFTEHRDALERAFAARGASGTVIMVRRPDELAGVDGLILPGGESTTMSKLLDTQGLREALVARVAREDFPVLGTCAGLILLAKEGDQQVEDTDTRLLGLMDLAVDRNAFGRQRESFEADVALEGMTPDFRGIFIRAPAITRAWGSCHVFGRLPDGTGIAAREGNRLALAFHPELSDDPRLHAVFVGIVEDWLAANRASLSRGSAIRAR